MFSEEMQALSISGNAEAIFWFAGISCAAVWIELESAGCFGLNYVVNKLVRAKD